MEKYQTICLTSILILKVSQVNRSMSSRRMPECTDAPRPWSQLCNDPLLALFGVCPTGRCSGPQLVRYYGAWSNARRVPAGAAASVPAPAAEAPGLRRDDSNSAEEFARGRRRSWARQIKRVYEADPLVCPRCSGPLKIISLIGDAPVIEKILRHLKLWHRPERPPPPPAERSIQYAEDISGFDEGSQWPDASG